MNAICLLDTCIFTNILNVPGKNQKYKEVDKNFEEYIELGCRFILPMATILETGNHIAQCGNGTTRREVAQKFIQAVEAAFDGTAPYEVSQFPKTGEIREWLPNFPNEAGKNKVGKREKPEGTSFGDLTIVEEYKSFCKISPHKEIFIWSFDSDLKECHQNPKT